MMMEILGPKEQEARRMRLHTQLAKLLKDRPLTEVISMIGAENFCENTGVGKKRVLRLKIKEFIDWAVKTGKENLSGSNTATEIQDMESAPIENKKTDMDFSGVKEGHKFSTPREWLTAEEIEEYLKQFDPRITRRTIRKWINEMEPLNEKDSAIFDRDNNLTARCYSPKIVEKLKEILLSRKKSNGWLNLKGIEKRLREQGLIFSSYNIKAALKNMGFIYGLDYEERLDSVNRPQIHYSPAAIKMIELVLTERGEIAPPDWLPINTMIISIKKKYPTQIDQIHDYRKAVTSFIKKLNLKSGEDLKPFLTANKKQLMIHYSPKVVELVENFLLHLK